jgi:polyferredoxin
VGRLAAHIVLAASGSAGRAAEAVRPPANADEVGAASGPEIQAFRDAYVPHVFAPPSPWWAYADAIVLAVLLAGATWLVIHRRSRWWLTVHLAVGLVYFGLFRGGCLCPVGAISNVTLGVVHPELMGRAELAIFLLPLVIALAAGRVFCGAVCPLGAIQHFVSPKESRPVPSLVHRVLLILPAVVLGATVWLAIAGGVFFVCRLDPYKPVFFTGYSVAQRLLAAGTTATDARWWFAGDAFAWLFLALMLVCGWVIPRVFCRYLCPYGVLLALLAQVGFIRRQPNASACTHCQRCVRACPVQAIRGATGTVPSISPYQCLQCGRCAEACPSGAIELQPARTD